METQDGAGKPQSLPKSWKQEWNNQEGKETKKQHGTGEKRELWALRKLSLCVVTVHVEANIEFQVNVGPKNHPWHNPGGAGRQHNLGTASRSCLLQKKHKQLVLLGDKPSLNKVPAAGTSSEKNPKSSTNARLFEYQNFAKICVSENNESVNFQWILSEFFSSLSSFIILILFWSQTSGALLLAESVGGALTGRCGSLLGCCEVSVVGLGAGD